jgi:hypothetical protein
MSSSLSLLLLLGNEQEFLARRTSKPFAFSKLLQIIKDGKSRTNNKSVSIQFRWGLSASKISVIELNPTADYGLNSQDSVSILLLQSVVCH